MRYAGTRRSEHNPLRSLPLYRSADFLRSVVQPAQAPMLPPCVCVHLAPAEAELQRRELANAEAILREAVRVLDGARADVERAKRTETPQIIINGRVAGGGMQIAPERVRQCKAKARRMLAKRLAGMAVARGRVEAARAVLGLPSLVEIEDRAAEAEADEAKRIAFKALGVISREER